MEVCKSVTEFGTWYKVTTGCMELETRFENCSNDIFLVRVVMNTDTILDFYVTAYLVNEDVFTRDWTHIDSEYRDYAVEDIDVEGCPLAVHQNYRIDKLNNDVLYEFVHSIKDEVLASILLI